MSLVLTPVRALDCRLEPRRWDWAEREAARIDAHWAALAHGNAALYDGRVLLQHRGERGADGVFRGAYLETRFSCFLAWRDFGFPDTSVRNCFAMAALRAEDGGFLLGVMGRHTANAGRVYFPAGTPDPDDVVDGRVDLDGSVMRELHEETGLGPADVTLGEGWTLIEDGQRLACLKPVSVPGEGRAVQARLRAWLSGEAEPELADIRLVSHRGEIDPVVMPPFVCAYLDAMLG